MFTSLALRNRKPLARLALAITLAPLACLTGRTMPRPTAVTPKWCRCRRASRNSAPRSNGDDYSNLFTIAKDGVYHKVKPNSKVAMLNGKPMALTVPVVFKGKTAFMSKDFINQVFQSGSGQDLCRRNPP